MTLMNHKRIETNKVRSLTEVDEGWKKISVNLMAAYDGIHPDSLSKLAHVLFGKIIHNKMNIKKDDKGYKEDEAKRIFSSVLCQPSDLALSIHPAKYSNGESPDNDIANIIKRMRELEDSNIFYIWTFNKPATYIYIMERYVDSWKYYNRKGVLSITSIRKILCLSRQLMDTMLSLEKKRQRASTKEEIEESYGLFINGLLEKMDVNLSKNLTRFSKEIEIFSYISTLVGELKNMEKDEHIEYEDQFLARLPPVLRSKIIKLHKVDKGDKMNLDLFELEALIPKQPNLIKVKSPKENKQRNIALKILKDKEPEAEDGSFKNEDPFKNPTSFTTFYRASIRLYNGKARLFNFVSEIGDAANIMDLLLMNNRNNLKFLQAWIGYYLTNYLTGNNVYKEDKTCLKSFGETFHKYNGSYIG